MNSATATQPEYPEFEDDSIAPIGTAKTLGYSVANFGYGLFYALNNAVLSLFLEEHTKNNIILSLMSSSDSIEGVVVQPIVGSASDRLRSRLGRRRPFMLATIPFSALLLALTPLTAALPASIKLGVMLTCIVLSTTLFNIAWSPYQALLADITPRYQRGRVTSISVLFGLLGQAALMLAPIDIAPKFFLSAALMLITTLFTCAVIKESEHIIHDEARHSPWLEIQIALRGLKTLAQARKAIAVIFLAGIGIGSVFPLLTLFVKKTTGCTNQQAQMMFLVLMVSAAVAILPFGWLSDRWGAKRVLMLGSGLIVAASLAALWVMTLTQVAIVLAIAGVGNAAQSAARYPLLTSLVPPDEVGFYTGLQATAQSLALPVIAVVTGYMVNVGGYRVIFGACAFFVGLSMLVLAALRTQAASGEIHQRERERGEM
jgi:maltose/moltooligosaccharide transporter